MYQTNNEEDPFCLMRMSLRMEQELEPWQRIVDLVADERLLKRLAKPNVDCQYIYDEIFVYLADHWVVHAELNLDRTLIVSQVRLEALLKESGIEISAINSDMIANLNGYPVIIKAEEHGITRFTTLGDQTMEPCVTLKKESVVLLLRFIGYAIPVIADMVEGVLFEDQKEKMAASIYGQALYVKIKELGEDFSMEADARFVTVHIRLKAGRKLRFCVRAEKSPEMAEKIEDLIAAANLLDKEYWDTGMRIV